MSGLPATLAGTDVYLIDQVLKGRVAPGARICDAGAGSGRNLAWFAEQGGYALTAVEPSPDAHGAFVERFGALGLDPADVTWVPRPIESAGLSAGAFDLVICNAVLHFARDAEHFAAMLRAAFDLVAPGGVFFARLATTIGMEGRLEPLGCGWYRLPDESERFLVDEAALLRWGSELGAEQIEPVKTTLVQGLRAMTTWVLARL